MTRTKNIRVAGTYVKGISHDESEKPCQDRTYQKSSNGVTVISLADGAGSYDRPEVGAEIAAKFVVDYLCDNFKVIFEKDEKTIAKNILNGIQKELIKKAKNLNLDMKRGDLSSTLLFVSVKDNQYLAGHIGDGMIGYFENQKSAVLSYPENSGENGKYTYLTTQKSSLDHFRVYKNELNNITGFVLMSDGTCDSLYDPVPKRLTVGNMTIMGWLNNKTLSIEQVEKEIREAIESLFLNKSKNGDDCSIILMSTKDEDKMKEAEITDLTLDQLADNTKRIDRLQEDLDSVKNKLKDLNNRVPTKIEENDYKNYKSVLDKLTSKKADNTKRINRLKENVTTIKKELNDFQNILGSKLDKISSGRESVSIEEMKSIIKWKKNVNILLIVISTGLAGVVIKLLFFN